MSVPAKFHVYQKSPDEVAALRKIARLWHREPGGFWSFDHVIEALQRPSVRLFYLTVGAAQDGGAVTVVNEWSTAALVDVGPYSSDLLYIYTPAEMRGKGLARLLLKKVLLWLQGTVVDGCQGIRKEEFFLEVRVSNEAAIRLYESLGMQRVQVRKRYYADGEDALVFKCRVADHA